MIPDCTVHGVWVRSLRHDMFGRLVNKCINRNGNGEVEFMVMWEPDSDMGTKTTTASYHYPHELQVRPYKPRPWIANPAKEIIY